jgi:glycogen(starch) synthase
MLHMLDGLGIRQTVIMPRSNWNAPGWTRRGKQIQVLGLPRSPHYFGHLGMIEAGVVRREFPELTHKWDLIHIHAVNFAPLAYTLSQGLIPMFYSVYSFLRKELGNRPEPELQAQFKIQEELLMRCHRMQIISKSERNYLTEHFPQYLSKTEILPIGITCPAECRRPGNANEFLYVGRLLKYKGIEDLITATHLTRQRGQKIHLNIVGSGPDLYEANLKQRVKLLKLGNSVHFHGWKPCSEVQQWMSRGTCLVVPSRREAFGLVALEGMATGIPLIASRAGGLAEIISHACALTFEAGNVKQLSKVLITALNNPSLLQFLAASARQRALTFDWKQLAPKYLTLLEQMKL